MSGKPVFNCSSNLISFSADKVTTGTYNLQSVILNSSFLGLLIAATVGVFPSAASTFLVAFEVNTQFLLDRKPKLISQFINGILNDLQKLLKCCNGTTTFINFCNTTKEWYIIFKCTFFII